MNGVAQGVGVVFRAWQGVSGPASPTVRFVVVLRMCYRSDWSENGRRRGKYSEPRAYRSWGSARFRRCRDLGRTQRVGRGSGRRREVEALGGGDVDGGGARLARWGEQDGRR